MRKTKELQGNPCPVGRLLRAHREAHNLFQLDIGAITGKTQQYLSRVERGTGNQMRMDIAQDIVGKLGYKIVFKNIETGEIVEV